ncbi:transcription elongation factor GreB [Fluviibacter phosphoraccumulans]|jgi:transcription elongation factor GreB|uniref:transcription elongation factor GreB n=1 Tax=Fluviibacter phosphoraccumulans TaxID=1751046 RepID=UPI0010B71E87|nr:transcription elongation factor GreB [Fluviibacter phosphoraccumulans]BCA65558.1 transcription elongation factor GreB [Fluviibacter phosphoraccumulans]
MNKPVSVEQRHYMTPGGHSRLRDELEFLVKTERPKIVEIVSWAASNGDRSENGDYLYGKKRLREIDRRIRFLMKRLENAHVIDPGLQQHKDQVFFGATVVVCDEDGTEATYSIVGVDEADPNKGWISWVSPLARALIKLREGDVARFVSPLGERELEVVEVLYQSLDMPGFDPEA